MKYKPDCIFCKIANKEIPTKFIIETDDIVAFNDINAQAPVHALVIPKEHIESLNELENPELMSKLLQGVKCTAKALGVDEYRTVLNTGKKAGQEVFHIHFHILSGRDLQWPPG